jgi:hypothetical protein
MNTNKWQSYQPRTTCLLENTIRNVAAIAIKAGVNHQSNRSWNNNSSNTCLSRQYITQFYHKRHKIQISWKRDSFINVSSITTDEYMILQIEDNGIEIEKKRTEINSLVCIKLFIMKMHEELDFYYQKSSWGDWWKNWSKWIKQRHNI